MTTPVSSFAEMRSLMETDKTSSIILTDDLAYDGNGPLYQWWGGILDGDGHIITGINIPEMSGNDIDGRKTLGLFRLLQPAGAGGTSYPVIKNLGLKDVYIGNNTGDATTPDYAGGIVGYIDGYTTIENCWVTGNIKGRLNVGGISGYAYRNAIRISKSFFIGSLTVTELYAGGISGYIGGMSSAASDTWKLVISNCFGHGDFNSVNYDATTRRVGCIVGNGDFYSRIEKCYAPIDLPLAGKWQGVNEQYSCFEYPATTNVSDYSNAGWSISAYPILSNTWTIQDGKLPEFSYWLPRATDFDPDSDSDPDEASLFWTSFIGTTEVTP